MDRHLLDYLNSGKAWLLVGSGPSVAAGYPSWRELAFAALKLCRVETIGRDLTAIERAYKGGNFPEVFEESAKLVDMQVLLHSLSRVLPANPGPPFGENIYSHLAKWPIEVYLTTNFDNEILRHLAFAGEGSYIDYSNSPDHLNRLLPELSGAVFHLHGDLRSETGLILTAAQYKRILESPAWQYWRTKMAAVFGMNRVIVIGHSLTDPHIRHVMEAARKGSGVVQPVCWIAPDVTQEAAKEYLEKYRIRVISYDNRDGTHRNLTRLVESLSDFVPPRLTVRLSPAIARTSASPLGNNAAAPGFFVFSKLSAQTDFEEKRSDVLVAALHAALPRLKEVPGFSIKQALEDAGWPTESAMPTALADEVGKKAITEGLLIPDGQLYRVSEKAEGLLTVEREAFEHLRERFRRSLRMRLMKGFPSLQEDDLVEIALDIDAALAGFFREGGLTLASTLSVSTKGSERPAIPTSMVGFINQASAKYGDTLRRQAFSTVATGCFIHSDATEREYLGRVSQGFFGFHLLGVFGDAAGERIKHAKETVWLVDSSAQIPAIAVGCRAHAAFRDTFKSLSLLGLRFFSTEGLFDETRTHLWFADHVLNKFGVSSPDVLDAAMGNAPYRKANLFLEGFVNWQAAGNPADWQKYLIAISGMASVGQDAVRAALKRISITAIPFPEWTGFQQEDFVEAEEAVEKIVAIAGRATDRKPEELEESRLKAKPEAEAFIVVSHERDGKYNILSKAGESSSAWFLSQTAVLNRLGSELKVTWQPEAFLRFASTLMSTSNEEAAERAFGTLLWAIAQSGLTVLDDRLVVRVFGGIIDGASLAISEQHIAYDSVLAEKYGASVTHVMNEVPLLDRPLASLQLAIERAENEAALRVAATALAERERLRASRAEAELAKVEKFRQKMQAKQLQAKGRKRKNRSRKKK